jgi:hypothetical protein
MVSVASVWRIYTKPSMDGAIIFRSKTVTRRSARVLARNRAFSSVKPSAGCGGQGPTGKDGKPHTPWKKFVACERAKAQSLAGRAVTA